MRSLAPVLAASLLFACIALPGGARAESGGRLGVRSGYVLTADGLHGEYGDGWDLVLYFTEHLSGPLLLDIHLGAIYLGDPLNPSPPSEIILVPGSIWNMRSFYFSAGPMLTFGLGGGFSGYTSVGLGVYSVSLQFDQNTAYDNSQQHLGMNAGLGLSRRLTTSLSLEANGGVHYFGVKHGPSDLYWLFTHHADNPLLITIALGLTVDLH
jgi:hypothetical protein